MGVWLGPMGGKFKGEGDFAFSGSSQFAQEGENWEIALKGSGTFQFKKDPGPVDIFLVGGGDPGLAGHMGSSQAMAVGGDGGAGGECVTLRNVTIGRALCSVQIGGSGENTTMTASSIGFSATAVHGHNANGATGAYSTNGGGGADAGSAGDGSLAFGESGTLIGGSTLFGAGAGGGAASRASDGAIADWSYGGNTGGGNGGSASYFNGRYTNPGAAGAANTGAGGGGGGALVIAFGNIQHADGGLGGSGIVIIRNAR